MRPGEEKVRLAAGAFMRQFCRNAGLSADAGEVHAASCEFGGVDVLPAMAAALAAVGAINVEARVISFIDEGGNRVQGPRQGRVMREINPAPRPRQPPHSREAPMGFTAWAEANMRMGP